MVSASINVFTILLPFHFARHFSVHAEVPIVSRASDETTIECKRHHIFDLHAPCLFTAFHFSLDDGEGDLGSCHNNQRLFPFLVDSLCSGLNIVSHFASHCSFAARFLTRSMASRSRCFRLQSLFSFVKGLVLFGIYHFLFVSQRSFIAIFWWNFFRVVHHNTNQFHSFVIFVCIP